MNVIGVRFKKTGKIFYFDTVDMDIKVGDNCIVETSRGLEFGTCVIIPQSNSSISTEEIGKCIRKATKSDCGKHKENKIREKKGFKVAQKKILEFGLGMNLIDVEYTFDNSKLIFYFTAEGRVDFRELVKYLALIFKTRIELRQIGVRDEAKIVGALGGCGRTLCCSTFLGDFTSVSIKMAKEQELSLNPNKISGMCGRLMCCLKYEQDFYESVRKKMPRIGSKVKFKDSVGVVVGSSIIKEMVKLRFNRNDEEILENVPLNEIKLLDGSYEGFNKKDDFPNITGDYEIVNKDYNAFFIKNIIDHK